jgi:hypothetical protein
LKFGNGTSTWNSLPYFSAGGAPADAVKQSTLMHGTGDRALVVPSFGGYGSMLADTGSRLVDGAKFFTVIDVRDRITSPLDNFYGYVAGHNSTSIWLVTAPAPEGPWTWRQAVRTATGAALVNDHISSPEVVWFQGKMILYYHGVDKVNTAGQSTVAATSTDGVNFTDHGSVSLPVAYPQDKTRYYANSTSYARVVDCGGYLAAVFQANSTLQNAQVGSVTCSVGFATSTDGLSWAISDVPLMGHKVGQSGPFSPCLTKVGSMWWITAYVPADNKVNLYVSDRLEPGTFRKQQAWFSPPTGFDWVDSPSIRFLDGKWHIYFGATDSTYVNPGEIFHATLNWIA